jgi:hypothetical protein
LAEKLFGKSEKQSDNKTLENCTVKCVRKATGRKSFAKMG